MEIGYFNKLHDAHLRHKNEKKTCKFSRAPSWVHLKMSQIDNWLDQGDKTVLKKALDGFGKTEKQLDEDVRTLREWLKTQQHLPEISSDNHIINTLLINKFSIENCKQRLDMFYTIRTLLPEIYGKVDSKAMIEIADLIYFFPLPKRTPEGDRINIVRMTDCDIESFDLYGWMGYCYNIFEFKFQHDLCTSEVVVNDLKELKFGHVLKVTPIHLKKIVMILEKVYNNRVKQFHFLNCPSFVSNLLNMLRSLMKPKLAARIHVHQDASSIGKIIPLETLPSDYGGSELSLFELNELWKEKLAKYGDRFDALLKMKTNEKLRPTPLINDEVLGFHGNFKKLEMD
ncbi:hypothetical protein JTB14_037186 [Gonioctena quinquepunctata]|nr:hypothetical protein JTB14_037186 [Gonioctena quinquepunctata]